MLACIFFISSCSVKEQTEETGDVGELIINDSNTSFRFVAEETECFLPTEKIPVSLAEFLEMIYEPLFDFDGELNPVAVLAQNCVAVSSTQYRVTLKDGVHWHDGSEFNANDVIYTVNALKNTENPFSTEVRNISGVDFVSRNKVLFTLTEPTVNFEGLLSFPVIKRNTPRSEKNFSPNGTGPYRFLEKKNNTYYFEKNTDWHGGDASEKTISVTFMKDKESAVYAFEANEADVISSELMDLSKNTPRGQVTVKDYISNNLTFLGMNTSEGILSVPEIRCAVSYIIDKQKIVDEDVYGRGEPTDVPVVPNAWFCKKSNSLEIRSDGSYLERLLNENGWFKEKGLFVKDFGKYKSELTLSILVNKDNAEKTAIAKSVARVLGENGITVKVKAVPYEQYTGLVRSMDYSMFIGEIVLDKNMDPSKVVKSGKNYFGYSSEKMDEVLKSMGNAREADEVKACYEDFCSVFLSETPFVPLFFRKKSMIASSSLSGCGAPDYYKTYRNIENWYVSQKVELK